MTPEAAIKAKIVAYLKTVPGLWYCHVPANGYGRAGIPDYLVCYKGYFIGIEVKAVGAEPTKWQLRELNAIIDAGGCAGYHNNVESVKQVIEAIDVLQP